MKFFDNFFLKLFTLKFRFTGYENESQPNPMDIEGVAKKYSKKKTNCMANKKKDG